MTTLTLIEQDWPTYIQNHIVPLCVMTDKARVFALVGDLGAGKTTFSKTFLAELGVKQHVQSPTFSIINSYDIAYGEFTKAFHIDVYRIEDIKELDVLHMEEIFNNKNNLVVIEWADTIKERIPEDAVWIYFEHDTVETRKVRIENN
jgi:tRNA threonylcarbamoyladenosine biosynthesis protein TsaE